MELEYGKYYHIYNRGIDSISIFNENNDYQHFLNLYPNYIEPIAETYAWCLMKNHFHLLVRIKTLEEIGYLKPLENKKDLENKWKIIFPGSPDFKEGLKKPNPSKQFAHLFNAYVKKFNVLYERTGSLLEKNFEKREVDNEVYLKSLVCYIHNNPVHHRFCNSAIEYPWSSYLTIISLKPTKLKREKVIGWFDTLGNFISTNPEDQNYDDILDLLIDF
jgi:putative transposase